MSKPVKPREFWILKTPGGEFIEYDEPMTMDWSCCSKTHVIEYSALTELQARVKELEEALEKNKSEWEAVNPQGHKNLVAWQMAKVALADYKKDETND